MTELRHAKLVIEVVGNALKDVKQLQGQIAVLEKRGIHVRSSANVGGTEIALRSLQTNALAAVTAYDKLALASSRFANQTKTSALALAALDKARAGGVSALSLWAGRRQQQQPETGLQLRSTEVEGEWHVIEDLKELKGSSQGAGGPLQVLTGHLQRHRTAALTTAAALSNLIGTREELGEVEEESAARSDEVEAEWNVVEDGINRAGRAAQNAGRNFKPLTDQLQKHKTALIATTTALTAYITHSSVMALGINQSREELIGYAEAKGWDTEATRAWLEEESKIAGMSQRTKAAIANSIRDYATGVNQVKEFTETINAYWEVHQDRIGMSREAFAAAIGSGNIEQFTGLLQLDPFAVNAEWNQAAEEVQARLGYYNEEEIRKWARTRAALRKMGVEADTPEFKKALENIKPGWDDFLSTLQDVHSNIGFALVPMVMKVVNGLREVGKVVNANPIASQFVAAGLAVGTIIISLAAIVALYSGAVIGAKLYLAALEAAGVKTAALRGFTLAWHAAQMLVNGAMALFGMIAAATGLPVLVIVFIALAAAIALVAYKMGWLNGLFKILGEHDIGKVLSGGLDYAIELWDMLAGAVGGALDALSKAGGGSLFKMLLMAAFPPALLVKVLEPLLKPVEELLGIEYNVSSILEAAYRLWKDFVGWLQSGWRMISDLVKYVTGWGDGEDDRTLLKDLVGLLPWNAKEEAENRQRAEAAANFGVRGWTELNGEPALQVEYHHMPFGAPNEQEILGITGGKRRLYGKDWNEFVLNHPDLAGSFDQTGTLAVLPQDLSEYGIPSSAVPPRPREVMKGSIQESLNEAWAGQAERNAEKMKEAEEKGVPVTSISGHDWSLWSSLGTIYSGGKNYLGLDSGGEISRSGGIEIHQGEEVIPPAEARTGPGAIARAIEALKAQQAQPSTLPPVNVTVNMYYPQLTSQSAVTQMKFDLDRQIKDTVARAMRFYTR